MKISKCIGASMLRGTKKLIFILTVFTLLLIIPPTIISGQTTENSDVISFVVNSQKTYYGFNAGTTDQELRFRFAQQNRKNILFIDLFEENQFFTIGAYNNEGLFILLQDHPASLNTNRLTPTQFEDHFIDFLIDFARIPEIDFEKFSLNEWIIPNSNIIFADKFGSRLVIHAIDESFQVIENNLPYIGITYQYPFSEFSKDSNGDNSILLHNQLMDEINKIDENFSEELGIEILSKFQSTNAGISSVLLSPNDNQVFVSLDKDANEVWMFDINGGTVETYTGFDQNHKANIPRLGITTTDLKILNFSNENLTVGIILIAIVILLIILISVIVYLPKLKQNRIETS